MKRRRIIKTHFAPAKVPAVIAHPSSPRRAHGFEHVSKVIGASPAIVFPPPGPIASTKRTVQGTPIWWNTSARVLRHQTTYWERNGWWLRMAAHQRASERRPHESWIDKMIKKHGYHKTRNIMMFIGHDCDHTHGLDDGEAEPRPRHIR